MSRSQPTTDVPDVGDVVWLTLDPQSGHEQAGRRPALVLSPAEYNDKTSLAVVCPITNQPKGNPFEVPIMGNQYVSGAVLSDQVKSLDWRARQASRKGRVSSGITDQVRANIAELLGL